MKKFSWLAVLLLIVSCAGFLACPITSSETKEYVVNFDSDGGSYVPAQTVMDGDKVVEPKSPTKDGYTFEGWYLDDEKFNFDKFRIADDITLKAKWTAIESESEETEAKTTEEQKSDTEAKTEDQTTGKTDTETKTTEQQTTDATKTEEKTPVKFTVTFNSKGGSAVAAITVETGKTFDIPAAPTREYFTFEGWYLNEEEYDFTAAVTKDITLVAHWKVIESHTHTWDNGKVTTAATINAEGVKTYTCTVCGDTKTEAIEKLPSHSVKITVTVSSESDINVTKTTSDTTVTLQADAGYDSYQWSFLDKVLGQTDKLELLSSDYSACVYVTFEAAENN